MRVHAVLLLGGWGVLLWGTLQMTHVSLPLPWDHGICGPWGCGPPMEALLACHFFWAVLFFPIGIYCRGKLSEIRRRQLGMALVLIGLMWTGVILIQQWLTWYTDAADEVRQYYFRRIAFVIACNTDYPLIQVMGLGSCLMWRSRSESSHA